MLALTATVARADPLTVADCRLQGLGFASSPRGDEMLFDAAVCFARVKATRRAVQTYDLLVRSYPRSPRAMEALQRSALASVELGRVEDAAVRYEEYARRYAGESDARKAIEDAIRLRTALGDQRAVKADTDFFVQTWGARAPKDAAAAVLALASSYEAPGERSKALDAYIRQFGSVAGQDQLAIVYSRLGEALWQRSCPVTGVDGLCIQLVVDRTRDTCDPSTPRAVVVTRKPELHEQAVAALEHAVKLATDAKVDAPQARHALAMAMLRLGDEQLERVMATTFPTGLDFSEADREVARRSRQKFDAFLKSEISAMQAAQDRYSRVFALKDADASVRAAARIAESLQSFRRKLVTSEVPKVSLHSKDARAAYCGSLASAAEPVAEKAAISFGVCAAKATEFSVYNDTVQLCLAEVQLIEDEVGPAPVLPLPELDALHALPSADARRALVASDIEERAESALGQSRDQRPYIVLAMLALETGKPKLANAYTSLATDDNNPLVLAGRAVVDAALGRWGPAELAADKALELEPKNTSFLRIAAMIDLHLGRWPTANERLDLLDESYDTLVARAILTRALGDPQHAEQLYQRAIAIDGARPEAHFDLGLLYELHANPRDPGRASDEYRRAGTKEAKRRADALGVRRR